MDIHISGGGGGGGGGVYVPPVRVLRVQKYLSLRDVHNQTGIPLETLKSLVKREKFPKHDAEIGEGGHQLTSVGWRQATIDTWLRGYKS